MKKILFLLILTSLFFSCKRGNTDLTLSQRITENGQNPDELDLLNRTSKNSVGYVYTESNDAGTNRILIYKQGFDGSLTAQGSVASGGAGTGNLFGSQGALVLDDNHAWLYAVNAGSNSVSSFKVGNDGGLTLAHTVASGGTRPVSVTVDKQYLYVVNQTSANINGYKIGNDGSLTAIPSTNLALSAPTADPGQISFHPNGNFLYITERHTDKITSFQVNGQGVAHSRALSASGGVTPFGFDFARNKYMVVANAHLDLPKLGGVSSHSLDNFGNARAVNGNVANNQTAACWTATTDHGRFAYIANSFSDNISSYYIGSDGIAYLINGSAAPTDKRPRDVSIIDNFYVYVLNVTDHTITEYYRGPLGTLLRFGRVTNVPMWAAGLASY